MVGGAITFYGVAAAQSSMLAGTFAHPAPPLPRASASSTGWGRWAREDRRVVPLG